MSIAAEVGSPPKLARSQTRTSDDLLLEATKGLDLLLEGDLAGATKLLEARNESPWHVLTLGTIAFLRAALGMEDADHSSAHVLLSRAETLASTSSAELDAVAKEDWWPAGTTARIVQADASVLQAMMCVMSGSTWSLWQCAYRLNRTHRLCMRTYKDVFGAGLPEEATVEQIIAHIDRLAASTDRRSSVDSTLSSKGVETTPTTMECAPVWAQKPATAYVVAAAAYGKGVFDLLFSLLPSGNRSLKNLFYTPSDRRTALNLLHVAARYGHSIHAPFGSLTIMTYHTLMLQFLGWVEDREGQLIERDRVLSRALHHQPNSALWRLNEARIARSLGELDRAVKILRSASEAKVTHFPQAETVLCYELVWCLLAKGAYAECAETALHLATIDSWGTETYLSLAFGSLKLISRPKKGQVELMHDLVEKRMPTALASGRRTMGKSTPSQKFVSRRLELWQAKHNGSSNKRLADCVVISPALELALHFNLFSCMSTAQLRQHLKQLGNDEGDNPGDRVLRFLLRATINSVLQNTRATERDLHEAIERGSRLSRGAYAHVKPLALLEAAVLALRSAQLTEDHQAAADRLPPRTIWPPALDLADKRLDELLKLGSDLHFRVEMRAQALKGEIAAKRAKLRVGSSRL